MADNQDIQPLPQPPRTSVRPPDLPPEQFNPGFGQEQAAPQPAGGFFAKLVATAANLLPFLSFLKGKGATLDETVESKTEGKAERLIEAAHYTKESLGKVAGQASEFAKDAAKNPGEALGDAKKQAAVVIKDLSGKMPEGKLGNGLAMGGGAALAAHGAARTVGGLKKDENGKRNLRQAFTGVVETAVGSVLALAAFQQRQNGHVARLGQDSAKGPQSQSL